MTVAVVDDDLWVRLGRAAALAKVDGVDEVMELEHAKAAELGTEWDKVDVALIDAHDPAAPFDRFPGVRVVEALREAGRPTATAIVVSRLVNNPYLRLRLAEAGADYCYRHEEVADLEALMGVTASPAADHRVVRPTRDALAALGLGPGARPNAALRFIEAVGLADVFEWRRSQKSLPLPRRTIMRVRSEVGRLTGLHSPVTAARDLDAPDWRTVVDFVNRARGVELRQPTRHRGTGRAARP
jgi:CheY-like chemotaxis protein